MAQDHARVWSGSHLARAKRIAQAAAGYPATEQGVLDFLDTRRSSAHTQIKELGLILQALPDLDSKLIRRRRPDLVFSRAYRPRERVLSKGEVRLLVRHMPPKYRAHVWLMVLLGVRASELYALDYDGNTVSVQGTKTKGSRRRFTPPRSAVPYLEGTPLPRCPSLNYHITRACEAAGIAPATPNDLRRTAATFMVEGGTPLHLARAVLGHAPGSRVLEKVYLRSETGSNPAAAQAMDAAFAGAL